MKRYVLAIIACISVTVTCVVIYKEYNYSLENNISVVVYDEYECYLFELKTNGALIVTKGEGWDTDNDGFWTGFSKINKRRVRKLSSEKIKKILDLGEKISIITQPKLIVSGSGYWVEAQYEGKKVSYLYGLAKGSAGTDEDILHPNVRYIADLADELSELSPIKLDLIISK